MSEQEQKAAGTGTVRNRVVNVRSNELQFRKGVSPELIQQVYEELEPVDQCELIRKHLEKKHYRNAEADDRQKRSVIASLARKGFCMSDIISVMKETD